MKLAYIGRTTRPLDGWPVVGTVVAAASIDAPKVDRTMECPYCARKFIDADARYNHARVKHKGRSLKDIFPDHVRLREQDLAREQKTRMKAERDREPSLADVAIEATWKRAAGIPLDPLEESLMP